MITRSIILTICLLKVAILPAESQLRPLISREEIAVKIRETARLINADFAGQDLVIIMVLKGAACLVADLIREIDIPLEVETIQCSSYGIHGTMRGGLQIIGADLLHLHNRDILIVDDIFDSGKTMTTLIDTLKEQKPRSIKTCSLLYKKDVFKVADYRPEYVLFDIDDLFVVGYGLDFKEKYRNLPAIYVLENP